MNGTDTNIVTRAMTGSELVRTGQNACKGWIRPGKSNTISVSRSTEPLTAGKAYTFSAYVNTSQCTSFNGKGVYLQVTGNGINQTSDYLNYQSSKEVDGGWVRLSVTFTPPVKGTYTVGIYNHGAGPYFYADDVQVERAGAPSNLNLVENGNLQYWGVDWTMGPLAGYKKGVGLFSTDEYACSIEIRGDAYKESCAYQDIPIYQTGKTYVLSGWAKADAIPDNEEKAEGEDAAARDKYKQFGLRAELTYSDNSKEYHYVPFNSDVKEWQYASLAIVPKKTGTQVKSIRVICAYERNGNVAYFDNLS
ncbi:MAG: carbohydrate binding domain-containing protein [Oscillospiraceae bacterium]